MPFALLALAISAFAIGKTQFITTGLLQDIANDLHVSIPQAGYLTSGRGWAYIHSQRAFDVSIRSNGKRRGSS